MNKKDGRHPFAWSPGSSPATEKDTKSGAPVTTTESSVDEASKKPTGHKAFKPLFPPADRKWSERAIRRITH